MATLETIKMLISRHKDIVVTGRNNADIQRVWEGKAYAEKRNQDYVAMHEYFQQAEFRIRGGK